MTIDAMGKPGANAAGSPPQVRLAEPEVGLSERGYVLPDYDTPEALAKLSPSKLELGEDYAVTDSDGADRLNRLLRLMETVGKLDLDKMEVERKAAQTPKERVVEKMLSKGAKAGITRSLNKRKPGRPKVHWKKKAKRYREYHRQYQLNRYHEILKPRRLATFAQALEEGGWWEYLQAKWPTRDATRGKNKPTLTREEWERAGLEELIGERSPVFMRYDKTQPIGLYNVYIIDSDTRETLFDGKEQRLRDEGFAL